MKDTRTACVCVCVCVRTLHALKVSVECCGYKGVFVKTRATPSQTAGLGVCVELKRSLRTEAPSIHSLTHMHTHTRTPRERERVQEKVEKRHQVISVCMPLQGQVQVSDKW